MYLKEIIFRTKQRSSPENKYTSDNLQNNETTVNIVFYKTKRRKQVLRNPLIFIYSEILLLFLANPVNTFLNQIRNQHQCLAVNFRYKNKSQPAQK